MSRIKSLYLDNCSTTPLDLSVREYMFELAETAWGNSSSIHSSGRRAARILSESRKIIAGSIGATAAEIVFTGSGTEANNMAVGGTISWVKRLGENCHVITSAVEHPSVTKRCEWETRIGGESVNISYVGVDEKGALDEAALLSKIRPDTRLISLLFANNETGVLQNLNFIKKLKLNYPKISVHLDIVQAYGKLHLDVRTLPVDMLTFCSHKIHGPKGVGVLYLRNGISVDPILYGGAQEKFRRAGTEDVIAIGGFARAVELMPERTTHFEHMLRLETCFLQQLDSAAISYRINGPEAPGESRLPGFFNISFAGVKNKEDLQIALDLAGVQVSSTSACSSGVVSDSHVLKAMGVAESDRSGAIRIAFNRYHTAEDATDAAERIAEVVSRIKKLN